MNLQLEYTCTDTELAEAQTLFSQHQSGGKPKWLAALRSYGLIFLILGAYIALSAPKDRLPFIACMAVVVIGVLLYNRFKRPTHEEPPSRIKLNASESELVFETEYGRIVKPWSTFSLCLESPMIFALISGGKTLVYTVPKRAFPDGKSQEWFRTVARPMPVAPAPAAVMEKVVPEISAAKCINVTVQLQYVDYLNKAFTSLAGKFFCLVFVALIVMICFIANEPDDAEHAKDRASLIPLSMGSVGILAIAFYNLFQSWRSDREKGYNFRHVSLSSEGLGFSSQGGNGNLAWTAYKFYRENRWAYFVWAPGIPVVTVPKRVFGSPSEINQCRELLKANLKYSRWFYR